MNTKELNPRAVIERAEKLISQWKEIEDDQRSYEHERWHCVNVKRHSDYLDHDDLLDIARELSPRNEEHVHLLAEDIRDRSESLYNFFLEDAWEQLNYEISDIENITKGSKDEHKKLEHLRTSYNWAKGKSILSLGRSGGWACFQMETDRSAEDLQSMIDDLDADHERAQIRAINDEADILAETIEEIEYIKRYIDKFNKNLSWKSEVKFHMEEKLDEIREEEKEIKEKKADKSIMNQTLSELLQSEDETINRHAMGILKASKKGKK